MTFMNVDSYYNCTVLKAFLIVANLTDVPDRGA